MVSVTYSILWDLNPLYASTPNLFKNLSWDYKTNCPCYFGKKIIMNGMVDYRPEYGFRNTYSRKTNQLEDLERAFCLLEGKPEPDFRHRLSVRFGEKLGRGEPSFESEYFHFRWYQKGSLHVTFKRLDIIEKLNSNIAERFPNALPVRTQ